jgi:dipeptidase E
VFVYYSIHNVISFARINLIFGYGSSLWQWYYVHMKLYLSSYRLPAPNELSELVGKPLKHIKFALIPNAKDYYANQARNIKIGAYVSYFKKLGIESDIVDLRDLHNAKEVETKLENYDVIWAAGGNTFCLRYEMKRSGFDNALVRLLEKGIVYAGDSAGAIVAGPKIGGLGIEAADTPEFAESVISEGLDLIPYIIIPHADSPFFTEITKEIRDKAKPLKVIELGDSQAVIFNDTKHRVVSGEK